MKKVLVSCPEVGRDKNEIQKTREKLRKIAETIFDEEQLEMVTVPFHGQLGITYLGDCVKKLEEVDYLIWTGHIHHDLKRIASDYHIKTAYVNSYQLVPDLEAHATKTIERKDKRKYAGHRIRG